MSLSGLELLAENGDEARKRRPEQVPTVLEPALESFKQILTYLIHRRHSEPFW